MRRERASRSGMQTATLRRMSTQIAVRLPDDLVAFLDEAVRRGDAPSRAAIVVRALERERRRRAAEDDVARLREVGAADDLDDLVTWTADHLPPP